MEYRITFYADEDGDKPLADFLADLRANQPMLEKLVSSGLGKLRSSTRHGPPLTTQVDPANGIYELRVGRTNIARVFFFFRFGGEIVATSGYVKQRQALDRRQLDRARRLKQDWEARHP